MSSTPDPSSRAPDWLLRRRRLDSILRLQAAVLAGDPAQREAVQLLAEALGDPEVEVREVAAGAIADFGHEARRAMPELIRATQDESPIVRRRAIRAVGIIADPEEAVDGALPAVIAATEDEDQGVALEALATLGTFGPLAETALPALLAALWTGDARRRALAGVSLVRLGAAAVPALIQALAHPAPEVRAKAATVLGKLGPPAADAKFNLEQLLTDRDESTRAAAAEALKLIAEVK